VEGVAASQAADIIVIFNGIDANSTGVTARAQALDRKRGIDMFVILFLLLVTGYTFQGIRC